MERSINTVFLNVCRVCRCCHREHILVTCAIASSFLCCDILQLLTVVVTQHDSVAASCFERFLNILCSVPMRVNSRVPTSPENPGIFAVIFQALAKVLEIGSEGSAKSLNFNFCKTNL